MECSTFAKTSDIFMVTVLVKVMRGKLILRLLMLTAVQFFTLTFKDFSAHLITGLVDPCPANVIVCRF